jgi:hypothetical protein
MPSTLVLAGQAMDEHHISIPEQPQQVILWRSRIRGSIQVHTTYGPDPQEPRSPDHTTRQTQLERRASIVNPAESSGSQRGLVIASPHHLTRVVPGSNSPPLVQTCPFCFQDLPDGEFTPTGNRMRNEFSYPFGTDVDPGEGSVDSDRTSEEVNDAGTLAIDPRRSQRHTQLLRTQPYFQMLERNVTSPLVQALVPESQANSTSTSRRNSIGDLGQETSQAPKVNVDQYYAKQVRFMLHNNPRIY